MTEGSVADRANVAVSPLAAVGPPPVKATGGALTTVSVVGVAVVVPPVLPSETCTLGCSTAGPSLIERPSSCGQVSVGATPVASPNTPSPLRSQLYVSGSLSASREADASKWTPSPSTTVYGPPASATGGVSPEVPPGPPGPVS